MIDRAHRRTDHLKVKDYQPLAAAGGSSAERSKGSRGKGPLILGERGRQ
jgi:hypothetical protein